MKALARAPILAVGVFACSHSGEPLEFFGCEDMNVIELSATD